MNEKKFSRDDLLLSLLFFSITIITRIPFRSKLLYHMDSVQFALALENYDITVHQPHPPGYFLYVMLGRLINLFIKDANNTFIFISILFSGLAVVAIYYLGREIFDKKTGILVALIALTSPNLWFHGEVALTYVVEAFFSTFVALLCWRIFKGEHKYLWLSVVALGIAGGIRQNTVVFLLPLWLFSVKGVTLRKIIASLGLLGVVCLLWFVPMVWMTGGWNAYQSAFRELWLFNTGNISVFEKGWESYQRFSTALAKFVLYGVGAGIFIWTFILGIEMYSLIQHRKPIFLDRGKVIFFSLWIVPPTLFYLLIFIHPSNPGYVLIFLPALLLLTAASIGQLNDNIKMVFKKYIAMSIMLLIITINTFIFLFSKSPVTYQEIKTHDRNLSMMIDRLKSFDPLTTGVFVGPYIFYGYRHIMYYLPGYRVYHVDFRVSKHGEARKTFWGVNRETFLSDEIIIPKTVSEFVTPLLLMDVHLKSLKLDSIKGTTVSNVYNTNIYLLSGNIHLIKSIYPELKIYL